MKVVSFCDVDKRKLKHGAYEEYDDKTRSVQFTIPIVPIRFGRSSIHTLNVFMSFSLSICTIDSTR